MNDSDTSTYLSPQSWLWLVEVQEFEARAEHQRQVIANIGAATVGRIADIWLAVMMPESHAVVLEGGKAKVISFRTRDDLRQFQRTFGGQKLKRAR